MMRRAEAILVILTLASLPLILLAQSNTAPACDGMCCIRHPMHAAGSGHAGSEAMSCHRGAAAHLFQCGMHSKQPRSDNAMLAPLPPTMLSAITVVPAPMPARNSRAQGIEQVPPGFLSVPFEPPRS
jgi:hypothetical protein